MGCALGAAGGAVVRAVLDLSNRPHFASDLPLDEEYVGGVGEWDDEAAGRAEAAAAAAGGEAAGGGAERGGGGEVSGGTLRSIEGLAEAMLASQRHVSTHALSAAQLQPGERALGGEARLGGLTVTSPSP